jgi:hypothetical protein
VEIVGTSGLYSINGPLSVISLCGPGEQISCGGYFGVFQNIYNYGLPLKMLCCKLKSLNRKI